MTVNIDLGNGYNYRPKSGVYKGDELIITEPVLFAITRWQDFVKGYRETMFSDDIRNVLKDWRNGKC